ncbi:MAG: glutathione peroxidase [Phycisphaeraceae bacterium]|nr:glutathione peroxidase [Phycisphaeraceae bacterium]
MTRSILIVALALALISGCRATTERASQQEQTPMPAALDFTMNSIDGKPVKLSRYLGKVVLIVNVASKCGHTPQYADLQALYEKYHDQGLEILGFPCNQFRGQEPGDAAQIKSFCQTNYGVTFDMFAKIDVNGPKAAPLYQYLTGPDLPIEDQGKVKWNFEKFLLDRQGNVIARYRSKIKPSSDEVVDEIEAALDGEG